MAHQGPTRWFAVGALSTFATVLAVLMLVVAPAHGGTPHIASNVSAKPMDEKAALALSRAAVGRELSNYTFRDRRGRAVRLADFRGKPVIVNMIYTSCDHTCPALTYRVAQVASVARAALGKDSFVILTIGFDTRNDTPARMRAYALDRGIGGRRWRFLSTDAASAKALSRELGFTYFVSPNGFDHIAQTTILDAKGKVHTQVYGSDFVAPAIVEPLKELILGTTGRSSVGQLIERVRLFCTVYDPRTGRYHFDFSLIVMIVMGGITLGAIGTGIFREWRKSVRSRPSA